MAIAFVNATNAQDASSQTPTLAVTYGSGVTVVVGVVLSGTSQTVSSVSDDSTGGSGFVVVTAKNGNNVRVEEWTCLTSGSGATTITVHLSASNSSPTIGATWYSGVGSIGSNNNTGSGNSKFPSVAVNVTNSTSWVAAAMGTSVRLSATHTWSASVGNLRTSDTGSSTKTAVGMMDNTGGASSDTCTAQITNAANWAAVGVELVEAAANPWGWLSDFSQPTDPVDIVSY